MTQILHDVIRDPVSLHPSIFPFMWYQLYLKDVHMLCPPPCNELLIILGRSEELFRCLSKIVLCVP